MTCVLEPPPLTRVEPVTNVLHGVEVTDPYRWLEEQDSAETRSWLEAQAVHTRAYLDALPGRDHIRTRVQQLLDREVVFDPWKVRNRCFFLRRSAHHEQFCIVMREGEGEESRDSVLVDPLETDPTGATAVRILAISQEGDLLAYRIHYGGDACHFIQCIDVATKQSMGIRLPLGVSYGFVFSSDKRGFYYASEYTDAARPHYRAVYRFDFGQAFNEGVEIFFAGEDRRLHLELFGSADGRFLGYRVFRGDEPRTYSVYLQDMRSGTPPRKVLESVGIFFTPCFADSRLFLLTDWEAPNLRVVALDLDNLEHNSWIEVVPERKTRIMDFYVAEHLVYVAFVENLSTKIDVFDQSGGEMGTVPCPPYSTVGLFRHSEANDTLFYSVSSVNHPPTVFSWKSNQQNKWFADDILFDPSSVRVEQSQYRSKDGTNVPISLVMQKGRESFRPLPVFLTGYGGYASSRTLAFNAYSTFLIESGFLFALAHLRGGGEFGADWHLGGMRHNRQNAFDDFIAAAEWLIGQGLTTPDKIAIGGMSNGGLLVGAALTQRPDLFPPPYA